MATLSSREKAHKGRCSLWIGTFDSVKDLYKYFCLPGWYNSEREDVRNEFCREFDIMGDYEVTINDETTEILITPRAQLIPVDYVINNSSLPYDQYFSALEKASNLKLKTANTSLVASDFDYEYNLEHSYSKPLKRKRMVFVGSFPYKFEKLRQ